MKQGTAFCYHCKKKFFVSKIKGPAIMLTVVCILLIAANTAIMVSSENFVPVVIMIADSIVITGAILAMPLMVSFRPMKLSKAEKRDMNRKTRKKTGK